MPEQLTIFGFWETVVPAPAEPPAPPPPPPELPPPIDPRQTDLLSGPQSMRGALESACEALDADAVRARHAGLNRRFLHQRWADRAPDWAAGIEWLVGRAGAALSVDQQVERALALGDEVVQAGRFPSLPRRVPGAVQSAALRQAAERLIAERGPAA